MRESKHINTGLRAWLEKPHLYDFFQTLIGGNAERIRQYERYIPVKSGEKILDIGCGTGLLADWIEDGVEYVGCDMEEAYIEHAKKKYGDRGEFILGRAEELAVDRWENHFNYVMAHGLLHHLTDEESEILVRHSYNFLKDGGKFVSFDSVFHDEQSSLERWIVSRDRGQNIRTADDYFKLARTTFKQVEGTIDQGKLRIPFSVFAMICTK